MFFLAESFEQLKVVYLRFKDDLSGESMTLSDFSSLIPFAVSTLELGLPSGRDLVMAGPFEEPDEYFLRNRKRLSELLSKLCICVLVS